MIKEKMLTVDVRRTVRWLAIFLFFASTPQAIFRIAAKVLRPVMDAAEDVVATVEDLANE